jgi:hypothetical protein
MVFLVMHHTPVELIARVQYASFWHLNFSLFSLAGIFTELFEGGILECKFTGTISPGPQLNQPQRKSNTVPFRSIRKAIWRVTLQTNGTFFGGLICQLYKLS